MIEQELQSELRAIAWREHQCRLWRAWGRCWLAVAAAGWFLVLLGSATGWRLGGAETWLAGGALAAALIAWWRWRSAVEDRIDAARRIEARDPRLQGLLLTAAEQHPDAVGRLHYLQERVVSEALEANRRRPWGQDSVERLFLMRAGHWLALGVLAITLLVVQHSGQRGSRSLGTWLAGVEVTPGDCELERGASLVVVARFERGLPSAARLVARSDHGERSVPLVRSLDDPVYGGALRDVGADLTYWVEYGERRTREFRVTVFDYPRLERVDARLDYPAYTGLESKTIADTRRITAVEGTELDYRFTLNKPVVSAALVAPGGLEFPLANDGGTSRVYRWAHRLERSLQAQLILRDHAGRTNRLPEEVVLAVFTNRVPDLKLLAPRGDVQASPLEEIRFQGEVADDFGVRASGLAYTLGGGETRSVVLGTSVAARTKLSWQYLLPLEEFGAKPGHLLSYYLWAEDVGPDGQVRRTTSDLFLVEVRPFDEIFRENTGTAADEASGESGQEAGAGNPAMRLAELQKEVLTATWNLLRRESSGRSSGKFLEDLSTIRDSQAEVFDQTYQLQQENQDARAGQVLTSVVDAMERALEQLTAAGRENSPSLLPAAVTAEQAAYEGLLQLPEHDYQITRGQRGQRGRGSDRSNRMQRQLDQLDLQQEENRYETAREATPEVDPSQREPLRQLNRLKELARRQQDLNQQVQELQAALAAARSEEEREELRRRLQRLRDEEQSILADVDELRQRSERPDNRSQMQETSQRLEETRDEVRRTAEALEEGRLGQAQASGQRAREQLEQTGEHLRRQGTVRLAEDLRRLRQEARRLAEEFERLAPTLQDLAQPERPTLSQREVRETLAERLQLLTPIWTNLLRSARQISEEAEIPEPLLSRQLQETYRQATQGQAGNVPELLQELLEQGRLRRDVYELLRQPAPIPEAQSIDATSALVREGHPEEARQLAQKTAEDLGAFQRGVDRAARNVLGDELEDLRRARQELDALNNALEQEIARATTRNPPTNQASSASRSGTSANETAPEPNPAAVPSDQPGDTPETNNATASRGGRNRFFDRESGTGGTERRTSGPLTGPDYRGWSERLAQVEDLVEAPDLKEELARVRDRARTVRRDYLRHGQPPQWEFVQSEIQGPLGNVRRRVEEEIARRQSPDAMVPVDRDPVPERYQEVVRRYYEELGR